MRFFYILLFCCGQLAAQNVMISNQFSPNETSIMMDPKRPNVLIAAANLDNYYISTDTGRTWTSGTLSSSYGVWGDPTIAVDTMGHFYFFHLSNPASGNWIDRIVCQKTVNDGNTWSDGAFAGLNGTKAQDKQWCAVDRNTNHLYITWTQFDNYGSSNSNDSSLILFSKSTDGGQTWSAAQRISARAGDCVDEDNTVEGAVPTVGPNGEVYVAWAGPNGLVFNKSIDGGNTWLAQETPITNTPGGWDYAVPGIYRANGLPVTTCDVSNGPNRGTIYVNWSDQRNGDTDIWLCKSTDGGQNWSAPIKVNDDNSGKHQFFTWMTVDQSNGNLYFVFYDRRNHNDDSTDVYLAVSTDGGQTFINRRISETPFFPNNGVFFGDYTNIVAHNGIVRPIWTRLHNGQLSVWTHLTNEQELISGLEAQQTESTNLEFENFPNPSNNYAFASFKLHGPTFVDLKLLDMNGRVVATIINKEQRGYGKYVERIELNSLHLSSGTYLLRLELNGKVKTQRQIFVD